MLKRFVLVAFTFAASMAAAQESSPAAPAQTAAAQADPSAPKSMSGMSILGNQEAPKSVDKDVFMRELKYYSIRSGTEK